MTLDWPAIIRALRDFIAGLMARPAGHAGPFQTVTLELPSGYSRSADEMRVRMRVVERARNILGVPYLRGAKDGDLRIETPPPAIDCSGLVRLAFSQESYFSREIPDGACNQHAFCRPFAGEPLPADLHFWSYPSRKRPGTMDWHVAIQSEQGTLINATGTLGAVTEETPDRLMAHAGYLGCRRHPDFILKGAT